jgi:uncharacterized protein YbcV (DUF1398 family)
MTWEKYTVMRGNVMIIWELDLQLSMKSMPIITKVVSLNPTQTLCDKVCQRLATGQLFSSGTQQ